MTYTKYWIGRIGFREIDPLFWALVSSIPRRIPSENEIADQFIEFWRRERK